MFVATGDFDSDLDAQRAANAAGIPVNVADRPQLSDFILPAIVDRDEVVVAISTGGASPTLATLLRGRIEAMLPTRFGAVAKLARDLPRPGQCADRAASGAAPSGGG